MLREAVEAVEEPNPEDFRTAYDEMLVSAVESVGVAAAAEQSGVDEDVLRALVDGESADLSLEAAAAILAVDPDRPDAEAIHAEAQDVLMMGMSSAVLDVEALASGIDGELEPKEIQQKVEGRYPMTLDEYALLHAYIEERKR